MTTLEPRPVVVPEPDPVVRSRRARVLAGLLPGPAAGLVPGLVAAGAGLAAAQLAHHLVPQVGVLTWAIGLGVLGANIGLVPASAAGGLSRITKRLLRVGIVLLGFSVSFAAMASLGVPVIALIGGALVGTLVLTTWLGRRLGLNDSRSLLIATGTAICGASAIAAMEDTADGDEEDVAVAIAMVTLFGTLMLILLPLLRGPLGLSDAQFGLWAGASVHEVGQVVAAASPAGAAALAVAVVVKLTRVVMLAPVVAAVSVVRRVTSTGTDGDVTRPPLVPLFVLGFLACVALRSTGLVPDSVLGWITQLQVAALAAALFGMGTSVRIAALVQGSKAAVVVSAAGTVFLSAVTLAGALVLAR